MGGGGGIRLVKGQNECNHFNKRTSTGHLIIIDLYYSSICLPRQIVCVCVCLQPNVYSLGQYRLDSTVLLLDQLRFCIINISKPTKGVLTTTQNTHKEASLRNVNALILLVTRKIRHERPQNSSHIRSEQRSTPLRCTVGFVHHVHIPHSSEHIANTHFTC